MLMRLTGSIWCSQKTWGRERKWQESWIRVTHMAGVSEVESASTDHLLLPAVGLCLLGGNVMVITLCPVQTTPPAKTISDDTRMTSLMTMGYYFISSQSKWFLLLSNFLGSAALGITLQSLLTHTGRLSLTPPCSPLSLILRFYTGPLFSLELLHPCPDYSWASFKFETLWVWRRRASDL